MVCAAIRTNKRRCYCAVQVGTTAACRAHTSSTASPVLETVMYVPSYVKVEQREVEVVIKQRVPFRAAQGLAFQRWCPYKWWVERGW